MIDPEVNVTYDLAIAEIEKFFTLLEKKHSEEKKRLIRESQKILAQETLKK